MRSQTRQAGFTSWSVFVLFGALAAAIAFTGWLYYRADLARARAAAEEELNVIADLKVGEIAAWRRQRLEDAAAVRTDPAEAQRVRDLLDERKAPAADDDRILTWMREAGDLFGYRDVTLLDADLRRLAAIGDKGGDLNPADRANAAASIRRCQPYIGDIYRTAHGGAIRLTLYAPIASAAGDECRGALAFLIDPEHTLYPLIKTWPTKSPSGETLLVRREGDFALFLNELRHRANTALDLRVPLAVLAVPAVRAVRGFAGVMEGVDYRGVPTLAATRVVPDTPWFLVAKVDRHEVYAPYRWWARAAASALSGALFIFGVVYGFWWNRRELRTSRRQFAAEHARLAAERRYEFLMQHAGDMILLTDEHDRIIDANESACAGYGYACAEFVGLSLRDVELLPQPAAGEAIRRGDERQGGVVYEAVCRRRDGSEFSAEINVRALEVDGVYYRYAIVRDITERKNAEAKILSYQEQLRAVAAQALLAEDQERRRIAVDLHDQVGQSLAVAKLRLELLERGLDVACKPGVGSVREMLDDAIRQVRSMTFDLCPPILYTLGLEPALEWLAEEMGKKHGLRCHFGSDGQPKPLAEEIRVLLYRGARELLMNVVKHAHAAAATIAIWREGSRVCLRVTDDGRGFDLDRLKPGGGAPAGFGLFSLRERLSYHLGGLDAALSPDGGAQLTMFAPLGPENETAGAKPAGTN